MKTFLIFLVTILLSLVLSQEVPAEVEMQQQVFSAPDVQTTVLFPDHVDRNIPMGEVSELLLGFENDGDMFFNVTFIRASFFYLIDGTIFRNLTTFQYDQIVAPKETATFAYQFYCDFSLEPRDYGMLASVYYSDHENNNYTTVFFNGTINIYEPATELDVTTIFSTLLLLGIVGLVGFFGLKMQNPKKKTTRVETGTTGSASGWGDDATSKFFAKKSQKSSSPSETRRRK
eukprot:TRINITY_DN12094_c0_g1_i1.p1 TRINITY_DN12094_c0_g1~~TRINITY_DN12094_c0_g1_i1.p1  ORF type:complete len:231 (-),score=63.08 TRINITY_DN12094_c0_g1_i1:43-735(-)